MTSSARNAIVRRAAQWFAALLGCALAGCSTTGIAGNSALPRMAFARADHSQNPSPTYRCSGNALDDASSAADAERIEPLQDVPPLKPTLPPEPEPTSQGPKGGKAVPVDTAQEPAKPPEKPKEEEKPARAPWYSVHEQGTIVTQTHDRFHSPYEGPNSLRRVEPAATTETATLFLDARIWRGGEIVFDPEISGGAGLSGATGVAGFLNGEATRVGAVEPTPYIARLFVRQTWGLDGEAEKVEDGPNQIAGLRDVNRVSLSVGKMSSADAVDNNRYSHDPRTQFLNWSIMYNGAWDYPANVRGYSYGAALEFNTLFWAWRYGIFAEPAVANGTALDPHILKANGQLMEVEEKYTLGDHPGHVRELLYLNHAHMGDYRETLDQMPVNPDITATRAYRYKYGVGLNVDQELTTELGVWGRLGWNDGHTESWAFTEIDRTAAVGIVLKGKRWRRPQDEVGFAGVINGLSRDHRDYLAAGGLGFIIGDGRLNYAPEQILETYYNWQLVKGINVTADIQGINHPAYNADRGLVFAAALRVHVEH